MIFRALIYLKRNLKRSIILFLTLLIISCGIFVGICTWNSINTVVDEIQHRLGTSFIVRLPSYVQSPDFSENKKVELPDGTIGYIYTGPVLDDSVINEILSVNGIECFNADKLGMAYVDNGKLMDGLFGWDIDEMEPEDEYYEMNLVMMRVTEIYGYTDTSLSDSFRTGSISLIEGRHINPEDKHTCLISEDLANQNGFQIGDSIVLSMRKGIIGRYNDHYADILGEVIPVEIVGFFHVNGYQPTGKWVAQFDNTYNHIFADLNTIRELQSNEEIFLKNDNAAALTYDNVTFFVEDLENLDRIVQEVSNLDTIDSGFYEITADDTMYKSTVDPLKTVRNWIIGAGSAIVIGCIIIIILLLNIWLRNRKKEIAIYLSMGFSKKSILGQLISEAVIITMLACLCSFGAGHYISNSIGNKMISAVADDSKPIEREITEEEIRQAAQTGTTNELFAYESSEYAGPDQIDFVFRFRDFIVMLAIEIVIIVAAVWKSVSYIHELQPRQILSDSF